MKPTPFPSADGTDTWRLPSFLRPHSVATGALAISCKVSEAHDPSEAESAFLHSDYDRAVTLYQAQLQQQSNRSRSDREPGQSSS